MTTVVYTSGAKKSREPCPFEPKTPDALRWSLRRLCYHIRLNVRSHQSEWQHGGWVHKEGDEPLWHLTSWEPLTSGAKANIRDEMQKYLDVKFSIAAFDDALEALLFHLHIDPLKEYFEKLPKPTGRNILPNVLATCMKVAPRYEELARWASVYMFLGVVWRTYEPGTKLDEIPILVGGGGIGKSTLPAMAVPQDIPGLYGSGLDLSGNAQRMVEALQGKAICEISEMVGATTGDMARIKDFISRTNDIGIRLSYRRDPENMPRRCIMIGTSDREVFLPLDNNHRRFVPIVLGDGKARKVRTYMAKNRERLWGEAVALYHLGTLAHLPDRVGNQQKCPTFVKERSGGNGSVVGLPEQVVVAFAAG